MRIQFHDTVRRYGIELNLSHYILLYRLIETLVDSITYTPYNARTSKQSILQRF